MQTIPSVAGRSCDDCSMCCKLPALEFDIDGIDKPAGEWCAHCRPGKGCAVYDARPKGCASFMCLYLDDPTLGQEWRPTKSKIVGSVTQTEGARGLAYLFFVDAGSPMAWRKEPFYSKILSLAARSPITGVNVFIKIGRRLIAVLPDGGIFDCGDENRPYRFVTGKDGKWRGEFVGNSKTEAA